jgi:hypothetical protein
MLETVKGALFASFAFPLALPFPISFGAEESLQQPDEDLLTLPFD